MRMLVSKCAICGGKVEEGEISEEVRVGNDFVVIEISDAYGNKSKDKSPGEISKRRR